MTAARGSLKTGDRWGDNMAVRGAGPNTQILLAARNGTNVALLTANDGIGLTYSAEIIAISGVHRAVSAAWALRLRRRQYVLGQDQRR